MPEGNDNTKTCPRDCMRCTDRQRLYCAATWSRLMLERMDGMEGRLGALEGKVDTLRRDGEGEVFDPQDGGQSGGPEDGAEEEAQ